jgi:hypothetical protein
VNKNNKKPQIQPRANDVINLLEVVISPRKHKMPTGDPKEAKF